MSVSAVKILMLYCPKCQQTYEEGTLRFCNNDGARLVPSSSAKAQRKTEGVFSSILGRVPPSASREKDEKLAEIPRFIQTKQPSQPPTTTKETFSPPPSKVFKAESELKPKIEPPAPPIEEAKPLVDELKTTVQETEPKTEPEKSEKKFITIKPVPRPVKPSEIPSGTASVGNRKTNPAGRDALTWEQPAVLLEQTIKGRYRIFELFSQDETGFSYLAEDRIVPNKKVLVRILMDEPTDDDAESKMLAEELVSLSHINHPNIASVIDSGELPEGKPFVITEFVEGKSVAEMLQRTGQFNSARAARIIRQASYALSEIHQNGILHRHLKPENIILTISESGMEQVKITDFGVLDDVLDEKNAAYQSPEQIEGRTPTFVSDIYSLAVIAFQMLTNRLPFNAPSAGNLLKAQRRGLNILPTNLRLDLPESVDQILEKALSFSPADRYPKARDFGDAFFNALTTPAPWEKEGEKTQEVELITDEKQAEEETAQGNLTPALLKFDSEDEIDLEIPTVEEQEEIVVVAEETPGKSGDLDEAYKKEEEIAEGESVRTGDELLWEKRSPEPVQVASRNWMLLSVLGLALLLIACWAVWSILLNRTNNPMAIEQPPLATNQPAENAVSSDASPSSLSATEVNEVPPIKRSVEQPPNTVYFENSKQNLDPNLAKKFLGFTLYYPKDWTKTPTDGNFLDISRKSADGLPVKQMIITRYDSRGTFNQDRESFASLAEKSNADLKKILPSYQVISAGESQIQNGRWKVYEVKFQNAGKTENDGQITLWGRRLWIPIQRPGMKSGFVITMLATSLSSDVKGIDDVGVNDELATILETFEPEQAN